LRKIALAPDRLLVYVDSSALVKLVIEEPESEPLDRHVSAGRLMATSRVALVEVPRATAIANPEPAARRDALGLLESCMLVDVSEALLRSAAELASASLRTLDAIHLASALRIGADELLTYDRRLFEAGVEQGLTVTSPA
jgi:uncharacterized protein